MENQLIIEQKTQRIESIDLLRGIVIIIMTLDHVRDYFHAEAFLFDPTDMKQTTVPVFLTRWITHFCAPVFVFLAGTSAFQFGNTKGRQALSSFLLKRGIWLILLELTVINFGWFSNIEFAFFALTVIWALAIGMIFLSFLIYLPLNWIFVFGILLIFGHNSLDSIHLGQPGSSEATWWSLIHEQSLVRLGSEHLVFIGYPIIPWIGVMALGYYLGSLYTAKYSPLKRKQVLMYSGIILTTLFILIRFTNLYGDPSQWSVQTAFSHTMLSFLNTTKYPPSLLYLLMTLGPALLVLAFTENLTGKLAQKVLIFGRVPMFYYIVHIYTIHILAFMAAALTGRKISDFVLSGWVTGVPELKGYGFSLLITYLVFALVVIVLFPVCKWYDSYKRNNRDKWWLSYL